LNNHRIESPRDDIKSNVGEIDDDYDDGLGPNFQESGQEPCDFYAKLQQLKHENLLLLNQVINFCKILDHVAMAARGHRHLTEK